MNGSPTGRAADVLRYIEWAMDAVRLAPVLAVRQANAGANCVEFIHAYNLALEGIGYFNPDDGYIRRRANDNRRRNKAARKARRANR